MEPGVSAIEYLMVFIGASMMASLIFIGLYKSHKKKTGKVPPPQSTMMWALLCLLGVLGLITIIQIADGYHVSDEERLRALGII